MRIGHNYILEASDVELTTYIKELKLKSPINKKDFEASEKFNKDLEKGYHLSQIIMMLLKDHDRIELKS